MSTIDQVILEVATEKPVKEGILRRCVKGTGEIEDVKLHRHAVRAHIEGLADDGYLRLEEGRGDGRWYALTEKGMKRLG